MRAWVRRAGLQVAGLEHSVKALKPDQTVASELLVVRMAVLVRTFGILLAQMTPASMARTVRSWNWPSLISVRR